MSQPIAVVLAPEKSCPENGRLGGGHKKEPLEGESSGSRPIRAVGVSGGLGKATRIVRGERFPNRNVPLPDYFFRRSNSRADHG